eukprot:2283575-Amphidinium_carterae.7
MIEKHDFGDRYVFKSPIQILLQRVTHHFGGVAPVTLDNTVKPTMQRTHAQQIRVVGCVLVSGQCLKDTLKVQSRSRSGWILLVNVVSAITKVFMTFVIARDRIPSQMIENALDMSVEEWSGKISASPQCHAPHAFKLLIQMRATVKMQQQQSRSRRSGSHRQHSEECSYAALTAPVGRLDTVTQTFILAWSTILLLCEHRTESGCYNCSDCNAVSCTKNESAI